MPDDAVSPPYHFSGRMTFWSIGAGNYGGVGVTRTGRFRSLSSKMGLHKIYVAGVGHHICSNFFYI